MSELAVFQRAAVRHIVQRLQRGSRRVLLADEVGLGKTIVARGVIEEMLRRRGERITVVYLCSNAEIAEQNRTKLDPQCRKPIGRVTELALKPKQPKDLLLYSFTPGTSLKEGTGLAWERRLLLFLLHRIHDAPVGRKQWRDFFKCGAGSRWDDEARLGTLYEEFERKTSVGFQKQLATAWRSASVEGMPALAFLEEEVSRFSVENVSQRSSRNRLISLLRHEMQRVALEHINADLVILDEVQRFRDVLEEASNPSHAAASLFAKEVPVLILSATPYRALTLGHEIEGGGASHYEDFYSTLGFLFGKDRETPAKIRSNLDMYGERLSRPELAATLDPVLIKLKNEIEEDLTKVICRTERVRYLAEGRQDVDDSEVSNDDVPHASELAEFFRLHKALMPTLPAGQLTEFWKSAPSLLTFLDSGYQAFRAISGKRKVPKELLAGPGQIDDLAQRNQRIARIVKLALGESEAPHLWIAPTYKYYRDEYFGSGDTRKVLAFSGWRFVPKAIAIIASRVATERVGGEPEDPTQPIRFTDKRSFHVFDVCMPSRALARIADLALSRARESGLPTADEVLVNTVVLLRERLLQAGIEVVPNGGDPVWQVAMRLEQAEGWAGSIVNAMEACADEEEADNLLRHSEYVQDWLDDDASRLEISEARFRHLALVAAFSPAVSLLRACESVYGVGEINALPDLMRVCLGAMRRYFNRPLVQQIIRNHEIRLSLRARQADTGYAERVLGYAADAHLQAVLDEYLYLLRGAGQADTVARALDQLAEVWALSRGNPRANGARGRGEEVHVEENSEIHAAHFALAFGEDVTRENGPDVDDSKMRKSVVREAFNSPFWPFVLATTSVGQEGLDFHLYCRDVFHWNLPSNPVDLEQREGRVNRRDGLAIRQSIAVDWPISEIARGSRNPWLQLFEQVERADRVQRYKHGLFPHWIYECRDPERTVRIRRHVPFFQTSRDAAKYERLKAGLALYRLVFGQPNQEDLLEGLRQQTAALDAQTRAVRLKRLRSYMLNLSPIRGQVARKASAEEADALLSGENVEARLAQLVESVHTLQAVHSNELGGTNREIERLVSVVSVALESKRLRSKQLREAVAALEYLRNPFDQIFDHHSESGFLDDIEVLKGAAETMSR